MKIGILTFHYSNHNFGALLQTYASSTVLKKMEYEPTVINLLPANNDSFSKKWKLPLISIINGSNNFEIFRRRNLKFTKRLYSFEECKMQNQNFDAFYVGSDQVWRPNMTGNRLFRYFLDFVDDNKTKISFAASFGSDHWEGTLEEKQTVTKLLKRFSAISVREDSGLKVCQNEFNIKATHVLDPTLLLTQKDYESIESEKTNKLLSNKKYAAYYILDDIKGLSEKPKLIEKQINVSALNLYGISKSLFGRSIFQFGSVGRWLSGIKNSTLIITDSYHCIIFSIIYRKNFVCLLNEKKGVARITSLLTTLQLEDRCCNDPNVDYTQYLKPINYELVYNRLGEKKIESFNFLKSALGN